MKIAGSERSFGLVLALGCAIFCILSYRAHRASDVIWGLLTIIFLIAALAVPRVLLPALRGWLKLGRWLGLVMNPLVLGAVYVGVFVPLRGLMRLFRRDAMRREFDSTAKSYWIDRKDDNAIVDRLKEQF
jgi:hypothetical protein